MEVRCGHGGSCTVTWPGEELSICEDCFQGRKAELETLWVETNPRVSELCAFECHSGALTRLYTDLNLAICDRCMEGNKRAQAQSDAEFRPKLSEEEPQEVSRGVWIGPKEVAWNREMMRRLGICRVLVCCDSLPLYHRHDPALTYHRLPLKDSLTQSLLPFLPPAFSFLSHGLLTSQPTLIHCNAGVSRSGAIAVAWLAHSQSLSTADALLQATQIRPAIHPNSAFLAQLKTQFS